MPPAPLTPAMFAPATPPRLSTHRRFAGWLAVAVLAHAGLLLIPSQRIRPPGEALPSLAVALLRAPSLPPTTSELRPQAVQTGPGQVLPRRDPAGQQPTESTPVPDPPTAQPGGASPERQQPSTAYLLDLAGRREWRLPETSAPRALGEHVPQPLPPNWRAAMKPGANRFDGMASPAAAAIVDRWLAADGSQNVVVTTADGETYCGRAEAWNPLNPLVEPIMTYRSCGGGKRTFDMAHPYDLSTPPVSARGGRHR
jgi:hypothetical protein